MTVFRLRLGKNSVSECKIGEAQDRWINMFKKTDDKVRLSLEN